MTFSCPDYSGYLASPGLRMPSEADASLLTSIVGAFRNVKQKLVCAGRRLH
ncbi:MAG TPA: hypothetical protein VNW54_16625 [Granulicella sp.]|nr:hypothetical protein [Granulicella sp.]